MHTTRASDARPGEPYPHPAALPEPALLSQCRLGKTRSSGPGGQHRNKVETTVEITHTPTGTLAHAGERRSAEENRRMAIFRLRLALATQHRCPVPKGDTWGDTRSALWRSRSTGGKIACNPEHHDFPSLLAEAMDMIVNCGLDESKAASRLSCTTSQLVKFVKEHPPALSQWNKERAAAGLHSLR